jgi:hypothetical protein
MAQCSQWNRPPGSLARMTLSSRVETCPNPKSVKDWSRVIVSIGRICGTLETQILFEGISPQEWYLWKRILAANVWRGRAKKGCCVEIEVEELVIRLKLAMIWEVTAGASSLM